MYTEWLKKGLVKPGKKATGLAEKMELHRTSIYKMMAGERKIQLDELPIISAYIQEPIPVFTKSLPVNGKLISAVIAGSVSAGSWVELDQIRQNKVEKIVIPRDHEFPNARHVAYVVGDSSMDKAGILEGDTIMCINFQDAGGDLQNGMKVVVERNRSGLIERSMKTVAVFKNRIEFQPQSSNDIYKPILFSKKSSSDSTENVSVVALVRRTTREL